MQKMIELTEEKIMKIAEEKELIIEKNALEELKKNDWNKLFDKAITEKKFLINLETIKELNDKIKEENKPKDLKKTLPRLKTLNELNFKESTCTGSINDFIELFKDKFNVLSSLVRKHSNLNPKTIVRVKRQAKNDEIELIGMVEKKWVTKKGHIALNLEDLTGEIIGVILKNDLELFEKGRRILLDDVIGIKGKKISNEMIAVKEITWPDVPIKKLKTTKEKIKIICISDIHVGSKKFLKKEFETFINWLESPKARDINFLFVAGDLVDGIGIYPGQAENLEIMDIFKQYELLENYLLRIPERIQIIIIPGDHDAVRRSEPQPALDKKYFPRLSKRKNVNLMPNPAWVEIQGIKILIYHGGSFHNFYNNLPNCDAKKPTDTMKEFLIRRDLISNYGSKLPIVPEKKDFMLLREVPNIIITGEMHYVDYSNYKGTLLLNSGTWQTQTKYQTQKGHVANPGIVMSIDLSDYSITKHHFYKS